MKKNLLFVFLTVLCATTHGQRYPIQASVQLAPPYTPYLADYTSVGSQKLMAQFRVTDPTLAEYTCKLRITIESTTVAIRTKPNFVAQPIILSGGNLSQVFYGDDLAEYFNPNALDFSGITRAHYEKGASLPEGIYRFTIEVLDYNRGIPVSDKAMAIAWIVLNDPPLLNLPRKDTKVRIVDPTNIVFAWTPRHTGSPNSAFTTAYVFKLIEVWPAERNPYDAFLSQPVLYETTTNQTQFVYDIAAPALLPGRKYAWQVQAKDIAGRDLFKNQGRSEVYAFKFGEALGIPENVRQDGSNSVTINLRWDSPVQGEMPERYTVRYRNEGTDSPTWYEAEAEERWLTLTYLEPGTRYEVQVRSETQIQTSDYSPSRIVRTKDDTTLPYACGTTTVISPIENNVQLPALGPGNVITSGKFKFTVTEAAGTNGVFSGKALVQIPMFNLASFGVTFAGIRVNDNFELTQGEIVTNYKPGSKITQLIDKVHKIGSEKPKPKATPAIDTTTTKPLLFHTLPGTIDSIWVDNSTGEIIVADREGNKTTYQQPVDPATKEKQAVQITDGGGNSYVVDGGGSVTKGQFPNASSSDLMLLDDFEKKVVEILKEYLQAIKDYQSKQQQQNPSKGGGPSLFDWQLSNINLELLPSCFELYITNLEDIENRIIEKISSVDKTKDFTRTIREKITDISNSEKIRNVICEILVDGLITEVISIELKNNGHVFQEGAYVLISAVPAMPTLSVKATSNVKSSTTKISFRLKIEYRRDTRQDEDLFPTNDWKDLKANESWEIDFEDKIRGGKATLYCDYGTIKDTIIFYIRGTNPIEQTVKNYINEQNYDVWFFTRMIRQESNYRHFNIGTSYGPTWNDSQGCPNFGPPHGWGLMQLDLLDGGQRPTAQQLWNWKANLDRGYEFLNGEKKRMVNNRINNATNTLSLWYEKNQDDRVQGHADQIEGNVTYTHANSVNFDFDFGIEVTGLSKSFADAAWIKNYNGSSGGVDGYPGFYYLIKQFRSDKPYWDVQRTNSNGHNYVEAVSNRQE